MKHIKYALVSFFLGFIVTNLGFAQGFSLSSSGTPASKIEPEQIIAFSKKVERVLGSAGARVAIIARMGRPASELPEGMRFTHAAFAIYSEITTTDGEKVRGYAIHNLYQRDSNPALSDLVQDYPVDFFSGASMLEAGVIIPSPRLQVRLLDVISSPTYKQLHQPKYSAISNPFTVDLQNCTEFVLDVINSAIYQTSDIGIIKTNTKAYFIAHPVKVNPFRLLLGSIFSAEVSLSDHPAGRPVTATFERIGDYLQKYDAGSVLTTVLPD